MFHVLFFMSYFAIRLQKIFFFLFVTHFIKDHTAAVRKTYVVF